MPAYRPLRSGRSPVRGIIRNLRIHWKPVVFVLILLLIEACLHVRSFNVAPSPAPHDPPFHVGCLEPPLNGSARANATLLMLARNSELEGAVHSVRSVQDQFNDNFNYPWTFLNDEPWDAAFRDGIRQAIGNKAEVQFEQIPKDMWGFPASIDQNKAQAAMDSMEHRGIIYAGKPSYHHMCRFQSG